MYVFKFGGASVKDAASVRNVASIIEKNNKEKLIVVVSAMGKTTNALEKVVDAYFNKSDYNAILNEVLGNHIKIISELFADKTAAENEVKKLVEKTTSFLNWNNSTQFNFVYDQVVSLGEYISTVILSHYLKSIHVSNTWVDAKHLIHTDNNYTDANILWKETETQTKKVVEAISNTIITQGFIGSTSEMLATTLGREGSDYTAAILSYCVDAEKMVIWKDVKGVYNADPKLFPEATIIRKLSFKETIEMTFYGAQVIHPKTIKPIQNKNISLQVRSFIDTEDEGTIIQANADLSSIPPVIVLKSQQVFLSFSVKDFSFLSEANLGKIISTFAKHSLRINLMQNRAISFSVCTDFKYGKIDAVVEELEDFFDIERNDTLQLLTVRHYNSDTLSKITEGKKIILTQKSIDTIQYLIQA